VNRILTELGIPKSSVEASRCREGGITPDKWRDFPHHHGKSGSIKKHVMKARGFVLNDEMVEACFHLGVALHYVQDSYVSLSTRSEHHSRWEEQMDEAYFVDDLLRLVEKAFANRPDRKEEYMKLADSLSGKIEGKDATLQLATMPGPGLSYWGHRQWGKPYVDVNFALKASYLISKSILAPKNCPKLQEKLQHTYKEYEKKLSGVETDFSGEITESLKKRDELEKGTRKKGFFQNVKRWFLTFQLKRKLNKYKEQKHLKKVLKRYVGTTKALTAPHRNWYDFNIPEINLSLVKKELLSIQEASKHLGVEENAIRELIDKRKISCYQVNSEKLVCRSELIGAL